MSQATTPRGRVSKIAMGYRIEQDVPMPPSRGGAALYPFGQLDVGDSFYFTGEPYQNTSFRRSASAYGTRNGVKLTVRKDGDGLRCWRIA